MTFVHDMGKISLYIFALSVILSGCTGLSKLSEEQKLISKYELNISEKEEIDRYRTVKNELASEIKDEPNGHFLWMRPRLAFHNMFKEPKKEKGFKHWLKYKMGKAPVYLDESYCAKLSSTFANRLYHLGHFNATSSYTIQDNGKTADVIFDIQAGIGYTIDTLIIPEPSDTISKALFSIHENSLIKPGDTYRLETLKKERQRIDDELKNLGFFYFNPDYIKFLVDTTLGDHKIRMELVVKDETPEEGLSIFSINDILVAEDFRLENYHPDTANIGEYQVASSTNFMKPKHFLNSVLYSRDDLYSKQVHNNTVRQLMGLRTYKYVNARYTPSPGLSNKLDVTYMMTPSPKMSVSTELNAVSKSNSFAGPGIKLSYNSKNFFRGAELFSVNLNGRFEKQVGGEDDGDTAYEVSIDGALDFPRLIPFGLRKRNKPYLPKASIILGTGIFARVSLYKFNTFTTGLSYTVKKKNYLTHIFSPIDVSVTNLIESTDKFDDFLKLNPSIRKSFEEQFIIGTSYNLIINKLGKEYPHQHYINFGVDPSGNMVALMSNLFGSEKHDADNPVTIFGNPVSQYFRGRMDLRYYFKTGKEAVIATRLYAGLGIPYGNSEVMPYVKQFYAGGTNSMRAFRARSLGPGSYLPPDSLKNVLVDQTGEIRLETNIEYRFPIVGFLKGTVFSDIGNIWLVNEDKLRPGGKFNKDTFYEEIAAGLGFGFRIDVDLMVLRFDWAFPIRKPWLQEGDRWVFSDIDLFNKRWRKDNLILNISIGYPF